MATDRPILSGGSDFGEEASRAGGHGDKYHPYTYAEVHERLGRQVGTILQEVEKLPDRYRGDRVVVQAKLHPNYLAASHHPRALRSDADLVMVGTRAARGLMRQRRGERENVPTKTLLFAATNESLQRMSELLGDPSPPDDIADEFVRFESFSLPGPERIVKQRREETSAEDVQVAWEAVLHPTIDQAGRLSERTAELVVARLDSLIEGLGGELRRRYLRRVGGLMFVPVRLRRDRLGELERFNPLRSIRPMPRMRRIPEPRLRSVDMGGGAPAPPAGAPSAHHRIAVFDGGVDAAHPLLAPFVAEGDLTDAPPDDDAIEHGTLVTSGLLYGHIQPGRQLDTPPAHVDHFRVFPVPSDVAPEEEPYWVLDQVVATLRNKPDRWSIVNLSLGPEDSAVDEDADIDRFTAEIDQLAHDLGVTVVVAVGNEGNSTVSSLGEDRIMAPSDGVNVLAVGSCDDLAPVEPTRAPYSCVGPGRPGLRIAPLGVAFGGSDTQQFIGAEPGGGFQLSMGTSFASPIAARGLATLLASLDTLPANVARGMAAHFAVGPTDHNLVEVGYGRFRDDYRPLLNCDEGSVTVVVEDTIERGTTKAYPLPYPSAGVNGRVKARWTVSFTSPTDPQDAVEYTQAGLEVVMRPNASARTMNLKHGKAKTESVDLRKDGEKIQRLANQGWELSMNPKTRSGKAVRSEHTLRDDGKWETVMRHEDGANGPTFHLPAIWITYYERADGELVPKDTGGSLHFTLVMSVDARKVPDLYEQVRADSRFAVLTPLAVSVPTPV